METRLFLPEHMASMCVSPDGSFLATGALKSGRIYLWRISTGDLLAAWNAHFKAIKSLAFTSDMVALVSGSEDSFVHVWRVSSVLAGACERDEEKAKIHSWADHSLPVSGIFITPGLFQTSLLLSYSLDKSAFLYDLNSGERVGEYYLDSPIRCGVMNAMQTFAYLGCEDSSIHVVGIREDDVDAKGLFSNVSSGKSKVVLAGVHEKGRRITSLALSLDDTMLVSSGEDGICVAWDLVCGSALKTFDIPSSSCAASIPSVTMILKPDNLLIGGGGVKSSASNDTPYKTAFPPLKRVLHESASIDSLVFDGALHPSQTALVTHENDFEAYQRVMSDRAQRQEREKDRLAMQDLEAVKMQNCQLTERLSRLAKVHESLFLELKE